MVATKSRQHCDDDDDFEGYSTDDTVYGADSDGCPRYGSTYRPTTPVETMADTDWEALSDNASGSAINNVLRWFV